MISGHILVSSSKTCNTHWQVLRKYNFSPHRIFKTCSNKSNPNEILTGEAGIMSLFRNCRRSNGRQARLISNSQVYKSTILNPSSMPQHISLKPSVLLPRKVSLPKGIFIHKVKNVDLPISGTQSCTAQTILRALHYFGSTAFAYNGSTIAGHAGMHILGCIIIGTINAVGGGTIRDILTGNTPVFWMRQPQFIYIGLIASGITFIMWPYLEEKNLNLEKDSLPMIVSDACGVASISIVGAQNALQLGLNPSLCILLGMISSSFGGVVRDILCEQPPRILYSHAHLYATTALCGSATYVVLKGVGVDPRARIAMAFTASMLSRCLAWKFNFTLSHWEWASEKKDEKQYQHSHLALAAIQ